MDFTHIPTITSSFITMALLNFIAVNTVDHSIFVSRSDSLFFNNGLNNGRILMGMPDGRAPALLTLPKLQELPQIGGQDEVNDTTTIKPRKHVAIPSSLFEQGNCLIYKPHVYLQLDRNGNQSR